METNEKFYDLDSIDRCLLPITDFGVLDIPTSSCVGCVEFDATLKIVEGLCDAKTG